MSRIVLFALTAVVALAVAAPAFASGREFGAHHAAHAQEMNGFTGEMNPGVMHRGYAGWTGM